MTNEEQILGTIQQISGIFSRKNISAAPINLDYLEETTAPNMENLVIMELILHLEGLFLSHLQNEKKVHKYVRYVSHFNKILDENSEGGNLIGKARITA